MFNRISKSSSMPSFVLDLASNIDSLTERLVEETIMPLFRSLHSEKSGWNLSLVNLCATNMAFAAGDSKQGAGRDIGDMFTRQEAVLKEWKVDENDATLSDDEDEEQRSEAGHKSVELEANDLPSLHYPLLRSEDEELPPDSLDSNDIWNSDDETSELGYSCTVCGAAIPEFAIVAHERFHALPS